MDEAVAWERHVLSVRDPQYDGSSESSSSSMGAEASSIGSSGPPPRPGQPAPNPWLRKWGLSPEVAMDAVNPGFADPFPAATTVTLDNPRYRWFGLSCMRGKLDWVLLRRLRAIRTALGNEDYTLSDHKWLAAEVHLVE